MEQWAGEIVLDIADRAVKLAADHGNRSVRALDVTMALMFVHDKSPLRLKDLLETDDANFAHDVFGILQHIDTDSGDLDLVCFCPRFLAKS